ncbi:MAG: hypothetical protein ACJ731_00260 [Vicinamibacterales bacterium]
MEQLAEVSISTDRVSSDTFAHAVGICEYAAAVYRDFLATMASLSRT